MAFDNPAGVKSAIFNGHEIRFEIDWSNQISNVWYDGQEINVQDTNGFFSQDISFQVIENEEKVTYQINMQRTLWAIGGEQIKVLRNGLLIYNENTSNSQIERVTGFDNHKDKGKNIIKQKILFLTSNPEDTTRLRIDKEAREIEEGLRRANRRDYFELIIKLATRPRDLSRAVLDINPQIIHFSGHGDIEGIILETEMGQPKLVSSDAIATLFSLFNETINCVILNSCYSHTQAKEISKFVPYVIGMKKSISDSAAIAFSISFYDAIGAGKDIDFAFKFGKSNIGLEGLSDKEVPILIKNK